MKAVKCGEVDYKDIREIIEYNENVDNYNVEQLSAGCKTVLNVLYNPDKVFCLKECGNNALEILFGFQTGNVYSDYALIPFEMDAVNVQTSSEKKEIYDYEELKEWWSYEE